ncbi:MAG: EAL domain-containing protein [Deltaproteobacteria bacterium]|nr:EAL domain-containing protein [Deltaproteobacteria bacterium]
MLDQILCSPRLTVAFQPIVDVSAGRAVAYEVLGRAPANLPSTAGYAPPRPDQLVEMAWKQGRLVELEQAWRSIAIERIARLPDRADAVFFFNLDTRVIEDPCHIPGFTLRALERAGLSPKKIVLELSERDPELGGERIERTAAHYRSQGFRIALDDWGAGFSTLAAIVRCRPEFLKVDRSLIDGISDDTLRRDILQAVLTFCSCQGIHLIAEGVERGSDLATLLDNGVSLAQGYLLGRPAPEPTPPALHVTAVVEWLASRVRRPLRMSPRSIAIKPVTRADAIMQAQPAPSKALPYREFRFRV